MKTKIFKIGMPFMVFLVAIGSAIASSPKVNATNKSSTLVAGYILQDGKCEKVTTCSDIPTVPCLYNGQIARMQINETTCGEQWFHPF